VSEKAKKTRRDDITPKTPKKITYKRAKKKILLGMERMAELGYL
jgi:hypothetical protein